MKSPDVPKSIRALFSYRLSYEAPRQPVDGSPMAMVSANRGEKGSDAFGPVIFHGRIVAAVNLTKGALPKHREFSGDIVGGEKG
jgi:hypothetical protein